MLYLYSKCGTAILAIIEAPTVYVMPEGRWNRQFIRLPGVARATEAILGCLPKLGSCLECPHNKSPQ